jgi:hypothetical protein
MDIATALEYESLALVPRLQQSLRLYNAQENSQLAKFDHKAGVLGACFSQDASAVFSGGLDTWVRRCVNQPFASHHRLTKLLDGILSEKKQLS